jgi:hypothetical protein
MDRWQRHETDRWDGEAPGPWPLPHAMHPGFPMGVSSAGPNPVLGPAGQS